MINKMKVLQALLLMSVCFTAQADEYSISPQFMELIQRAMNGEFADTENNQNVKPVAMAGQGRRIDEGETGNISTSGVDVDGTIEHYTLTQIEGPLVTINEPEGGVETTVTPASVQAQKQMYGRQLFSDAKAGVYTFTMPKLDVGKALVFELMITDNHGSSATDKVTFGRVKEVSMITNTARGIPPLKINYMVTTRSPNPVKSISMDYDGDGTIDETKPDNDDFIHIFEAVGQYQSRILMTDDQGNHFEDMLDIEVLSPEKTLMAIRQTWDATLAALAEGDIEKAITYIDGEGSQLDYRTRFTEMDGNQIDAMLARLGKMTLSSVYWPFAQCEVLTTTADGTYASSVQVGYNGVEWKIISF